MCSIVEETKKCDTSSIAEDLRSLDVEFQRYFAKLKENDAIFARNAFPASLNIAEFPNELQD